MRAALRIAFAAAAALAAGGAAAGQKRESPRARAGSCGRDRALGMHGGGGFLRAHAFAAPTRT